MLRQAQELPAVLQTIIALDVWNELAVLQHTLWLGRLLSASILREAGITKGAHLAAMNVNLKTIPVDWRRHRDRETQLLAIAHGFLASAEIGMKEHDRLTLAKTMIDQKLERRRTSLKLSALIELVMQTAGVGRDSGQNARCDAAAGAADCFGARPQRDDGEGGISRVGGG